MSQANRDRLVVNTAGQWQIYTSTVPSGATPLGTVTCGHETGALLRLASGAYVQINGEVVRNLDGRKVAAALGLSGRPPIIRGRRIDVYLDAESIAIAKRIGQGNVSSGIRKALKAYEVNAADIQRISG